MVEFKPRYLDLRSLSLQATIEAKEAKLLGWGVYRPTYWRNYLHSHSFFEVCFVYQGKGTFQNGSMRYQLQPNDLFIARPSDIHEIVSAETDPLGIFFFAFTLQDSLAKKISLPLNHLLTELMNGRRICVQAAQLEPTLRLITHELELLQAGYQAAVSGLLQKLLVDTARALAPPSSLEKMRKEIVIDKHAAVVNDAIHFLQDNYARPLKLRDIAAQVHLSERHLNRLFRQTTGKSVMSYLVGIRMARAKQLLLNPTMRVGDVAAAVGVADVRYFSTLFQKHTSLSPSRYRQQRGTEFIVESN